MNEARIFGHKINRFISVCSLLPLHCTPSSDKRSSKPQHSFTAIHSLRGKLRFLFQEHQRNQFICIFSILTLIFVISAHILENTTVLMLQAQTLPSQTLAC